MECLVLRTLLRKLSLGLSTLALYLLRLFGALVLDLILANVLPPGEHDRNEREHDRDYEQAHPVPDSLSTELSKRPRFSLPIMGVVLLQRVLLIPHVLDAIIAYTDESTMN